MCNNKLKTNRVYVVLERIKINIERQNANYKEQERHFVVTDISDLYNLIL